MSWHFLQAGEEAVWQGSSLDGAPAALSSLIPTAAVSCLPASVTDCWSPSPSGITSSPLTAIPGTGTSTLLQVAFPANPGALPGNGQGKATSVTCGLTPTACFARYDPATHSLRTSQGSLFSPICDEYLATVPAHGMMQSGQCWELATWVLPTAGNGSGYSWPTPQAMDGSKGNQPPRPWDTGVSLPQRLAQQMWPTPDASDWKQDGLQASQRRLDLYSTCSLNAAVRLFPTPRANKWGLPDSHGNVEAWATPSARDWRSGKASLETLEKNSRPLSEQIGGSLNPRWVEWLMGWPIGFSSLEPLAMDGCRSVPLPPGVCSMRVWLQQDLR